ncbi:MAG: hypothetical protein V4443_02355 [Pseudomonadota bacterium]
MNRWARLSLVLMICLIAGCAAAPQQPVRINAETLTGRIGVVMSALPRPDMLITGANCLTCLEIASAANAPLTDHAHTLSTSALAKLKDETAELLRSKGADVILIDENINVAELPDYATIAANKPLKDHTALKQKYPVDKLLVINITALGFVRTYAAYDPTSEPKAMLEGSAYIINLGNNTYEWYEPIKLTLTAGSAWDQPPSFPALTRAYLQILQAGKDKVLKSLSR